MVEIYRNVGEQLGLGKGEEIINRFHSQVDGV